MRHPVRRSVGPGRQEGPTATAVFFGESLVCYGDRTLNPLTAIWGFVRLSQVFQYVH